MNNLIAVLAFLVGASAANADSAVSIPASGWPATTLSRHTLPPSRAPSTPVKKQKAVAMPEVNPLPIDKDTPTNITVLKAQTVTATGTRASSFDINNTSGFVAFRSVAPRSMTSPPTLDLTTEPVLLRMKTGNTLELLSNRMDFPFESIQDRTVRNSELLQLKLYTLKFN